MELVHFNEDGCLSYLLFCTQTKEAVIIDPTFPEGKFLHAIENKKLVLKYILDTHTHADHASAGVKLSQKTGAPYLIHHRAQDSLNIPNNIPEKIKNIIKYYKNLEKTDFLKENDNLPVGNIKCKLFYTPGHTTDSISVKAGHLLFTGDYAALYLRGLGYRKVKNLEGGMLDWVKKELPISR